MDWTGKFWRGAFSEPDGTPSVTRVLTAVITAFALGWVTAIITTHLFRKYEPVLPDFAGLVAFVSSLYAANRVGNWLQSRNGGGPPQ